MVWHCSQPPPVATHGWLTSFRGRVSVPALRGISVMSKNSFGCFPFPHLTRKLKEREWEREREALPGHKLGWSVMSWNSLRGNLPIHGPQRDPREIQASKLTFSWCFGNTKENLCWIKQHCSESGQRITSLLCLWIYFRIMLTFTGTFS